MTNYINILICSRHHNDVTFQVDESVGVTCNLTTMGVVRCSSLAASMMPSAMTSHLMMPPKMFTKMAFTWSTKRLGKSRF